MAPGRPASPQWLTVCRHRIRGFRVPYLLVLQHHIVNSRTRIVAPVVPIGRDSPTLLAPRLRVGAEAYRAILLDMTSAAVELLGQTADDAGLEDDDAVSAALDAIFRGYPAGLP